MNIKAIIVIIIVIILGAVGYYFVYPAFQVIERNDPMPEIINDEASIEPTEREASDDSAIDTSTKKPVFEDMQADVVVPQEATQEEKENTSPPILGPYSVIGTLGHPASGEVRIIQRSEGAIVRYENFETINGPDLHVYLSKTTDAQDFIDLGKIKGTKGNINYDIPAGVSIGEYDHVLTWCKPFGVLFNYAEIR